MFGHKAFHHVHPIADSNAGPWLVSGSKLYRGFSWGSDAIALVIENQDGTMRNQFRDRSVMAGLTSQTIFSGVLIAIRVIQNSVVKEKRSPDWSEDRQPWAA